MKRGGSEKDLVDRCDFLGEAQEGAVTKTLWTGAIFGGLCHMGVGENRATPKWVAPVNWVQRLKPASPGG